MILGSDVRVQLCGYLILIGDWNNYGKTFIWAKDESETVDDVHLHGARKCVLAPL